MKKLIMLFACACFLVPSLLMAQGFGGGFSGGNSSAPATETVAGISERCTDAEMTTGTKTDCDVTPANAKVELDKKAPANPLATDTLWDAAGDLVQGSGANTAAKLTKGAEGTILRAGATSNAYSTFTISDTFAIGTIPHASAANTVTGLAAGTTGQILTGVTGAAPVWSSTLSVSALDLTSAASSIPWVVVADCSAVVAEGRACWDSDDNRLYVGNTTTNSKIVPAVNEKIASFAWDGGGSAVATANSKRCTLIPTAFTVTGYSMVVDQDPGAGTTILNLDKNAIGDGTALATTDMDGTAHAYPPTMPDNKVAVNDTTITGWTTAVAVNDMICATVATNAVATWISLSIYGTRN